MVFRAKLLFLAVVLTLPLFAHAQEADEPEVEYFFSPRKKLTIGVMELKGIGLPQEKADVLIDTIAEEIIRLGDVKVITKNDILSMLEMEKRRRLAGCTEYECVAEVGGLLGVRWIVTGSVSLFGKVYLLNLKLTDVKNQEVPGRVTRRIKGDEEDVLEELPDAVEELFDRVASRLEMHMPDRVSTAAKHKQKIGFSPSEVVVITRKDIDESGATSLMELLRRYPIVHVYEFDPVHPNVEIRTSKYILFMIDGREVNLDLFEAPFFELVPIGIRDIERVEIVTGPNSALYGANAVAAVINVMTRRPQTGFSADLSLAAGQNGGTIAAGSLTGGSGPWALRGSFGIKRSLSWADRDLLAEDLKRANLTFRLDIPDGSLTLDSGLVTGSGHIFGVLGYMQADNFLFGHVQANLEWRDLKVMTYWYGARAAMDVEIDLVHPDTGLILARLPTAHVNGDTFLLSAQYDLELFEGNLLIAGTDLRFTRYHVDKTVEPETTENRAGVFLHDEQLFIENLLLAASVRFDWNSTTGIALSPRVTLVYNPGTEHFLRLSGGTAFRKPTLMETSMDLKVDPEPGFPEIQTLFEERGLSNPNLKNEILTAIELGYRGSLFDRALRLSADVYLGLNREEINFVNDIRFRPPFYMQIDLQNSKIGYDNVGEDTNIVGAHFGIEGEPIEALTLFLRGNLRHTWFTRDESADRTYPRLLGSLGGILRLPSGLVIHLAAVYVGSRNFNVRNPESSLAPTIDVEIPARTYLLAAVIYRLPLGPAKLHLGLNFFNPFGARFREAQGVTTTLGENYGGEIMGTRAMFTARLVY
jgi:iron complex outermembrane receptor protein